VVILLAAVGAAVAAVRHRYGAGTSHTAPGGILIGDAGAYDRMTRFVLRRFFAHIAADVAAATRDSARVLEVGCGPGLLSILLADRHDLVVTGVDLDPSMIERARINADRARDGAAGPPTFMVGDVASLAFPDESFDLVVSTLSMHHWADPAAGLAEIGRVLRPDGRALVWDLRPGAVPFHRHVPDPVEHARGAALRVVRVAPWRWPWRFSLTQRIELIRADPSRGHPVAQHTGPTDRR
jgi:SAM-dependent methyltransferase